MSADSAIELLARRDRLLVAAGLGAITALGWAYLVYFAAGTDGMSGGMQAAAMPALKPWDTSDFLMMFVMWAVMMAAMMMPSAAPMILLYAAISRKTKSEIKPVAHCGAFASGYLVVWTGFSAVATVLQWALEKAALLSPMMVATSPYLGGALLIAAGLYQMTPLKNVCLQHCRSPVHFLAGRWRKGATGAFRMGLHHGLYCLGCCWALMLLLFVGGVMNLLWIAALAALVLLEKIIPRGDLLGRALGSLLVLGGLWLIV
jgi:predicted metal-binding membrane protein